MIMIKAENLTKKFGRLTALDSINLEIGGGFTLVLGPNGGGKSTFLNLCAGVYKKLRGGLVFLLTLLLYQSTARVWNGFRILLSSRMRVRVKSGKLLNCFQ